MGRRNINTTKSGKFMNPTDQARKEARKRELKKNKKQRQMVRTAVLKGKDPSQIIVEMEKIDSMEYNVNIPPALSEKVLKDKRRKLKETLDRVLKLYEKDDPETWVEIRRMTGDYEKKRQAMVDYFESVRHAQAVIIDDIPLPNLDMPMDDNLIPLPEGMPSTVPSAHQLPGHGILKKVSGYVPPGTERKRPPGCPPFVPPQLSDDEGEDFMDADVAVNREIESRKRKIKFADSDDSDDDEKDTRLNIAKSNNLTNLQTKLLKMSGQDIDHFMRESEVLLKEKEAERMADLKDRFDKIAEPGDSLPPNLAQPPPTIQNQQPLPPGVGPNTSSQIGPPATGFHPTPGLPPAPLGLPPGAPPGVPPPGMLFRPPPLRGALPLPSMRLPPPMQGLPPRLPNMMRMPPPMGMRMPMRPPGVPPGMLPPGLPPRGVAPLQNPNVLTAGPQLIPRPRDVKKNTTTIEAKPQIRSLSADVTRFLPTALRVKRDDKKRTGKLPDVRELPTVTTRVEEPESKPTKDDAYSLFMREMEDLL